MVSRRANQMTLKATATTAKLEIKLKSHTTTTDIELVESCDDKNRGWSSVRPSVRCKSLDQEYTVHRNAVESSRSPERRWYDRTWCVATIIFTLSVPCGLAIGWCVDCYRGPIQDTQSSVPVTVSACWPLQFLFVTYFKHFSLNSSHLCLLFNLPLCHYILWW